MKKTFHNDAELLVALRGTAAERREALEYFFRNPELFRWVLRQIQLQGGSEQDGKDVFAEAFIIFERQLRAGHFRGESSLLTWFRAIVRWQWWTLQNKTRRTVDAGPLKLPSACPDPEKLLLHEERRALLEQLFVQTGERCRQLLRFFQLDYAMHEIQQLMGYASSQVAANEVHACRVKLKKLIQERPEYRDVLQNRNGE